MRLAGRDSRTVEQALQQATNADPQFAAGYVDQARMLVETGNRDRARQVAQTAQQARLDPIDRANLEYVAATASGDATGRMKALELLATATPANASKAGVWRICG